MVMQKKKKRKKKNNFNKISTIGNSRFCQRRQHNFRCKILILK